MIKFSNQNEHYNSPPNYQGQKVYPQQQQRPQKANNSGYMQETFGHPNKPQSQQQYPNYQQQDQRYLYEQQKRQQQQNQNQTVYQQILQQQQQQQLKPPYPAKPQTLPDNNVPKKQQVPGSAQNERQNSAYTQGPQIQNHQQRLPSADPSIIQNRSQLQQQVLNHKGSQYLSNGAPTTSIKQDVTQRQATPLRENNFNKFNSKTFNPINIDQKPLITDQMYSPMPKSQLLNETTNIAKLQQQQVQQNRSPQLQKVVGGNNQTPGSNAQSIIEELQKEKDKHAQLTMKLKKLEQDKKTYNTNFLNDMEQKIKFLIQQNDQLQNDNMDLLQKAQNLPQQEVDDINKQIAYNKQQIEFLNKQINEAKGNLNDQIIKYKELETQLTKSNQLEDLQIQQLVQDLEEKVHNLIEENERLNELIQQQETNNKSTQIQQLQQEKQKLQQMANTQQKEISTLKQKQDQLTQKIQQSEKKLQEGPKENIEDLEDKIKQLIEENDYLNTLVQQQIQRENQIALLEEEMQNLVEVNDNLEILLQSAKK